MTKIDRRDFLLHVAPLIAAPALILGSVEETEAQQIKNFRLATPTQNAQFNVGQTVQISVGLIRTFYPKITRINFKANGQVIGTLSNRNIYQMNWQPTLAGNYTLTAEAILINGTVVTSPAVNVAVASSLLEVLHDGILSAPNWGSIGRGAYRCLGSTVNGGFAPTCWEGTLSSPKILRKIELITQASYEPSPGNFAPLDMSGFGGASFPIFFRIWNESIQTFCSSPFAGFGSIGIPNIGSTTVPIYTRIVQSQVFGIYLIGWDNLNFPMPANVPLKMSVQFETFDPSRPGQSVGLYGSSVPGPRITFGDSGGENNCLTIGEPSMASRIAVSS